MNMYEFSAKDRQRTFLRPQLDADKFEETLTNIANGALLDTAQYACFSGDSGTF